VQSLKALRDYLTQANPLIAANPEKLVFAGKGTLSSTGGGSLSHQITYTAELFITDFPGNPSSVFVPLLNWVRTYMPHLLNNPQTQDKALRFDAELLNAGTVDINIQLELVDRVIVSRNPAATPEPQETTARWTISHPLPKPSPFDGLPASTVEIGMQAPLQLTGDWVLDGSKDLSGQARTVLATLTQPEVRY